MSTNEWLKNDKGSEWHMTPQAAEATFDAHARAEHSKYESKRVIIKRVTTEQVEVIE